MKLQIGSNRNIGGMGGTQLECSVLLSGEKKQQQEVSDYWICTRQQQKGITATFSLYNFQDFSVHKEAAEGVIMENTAINTIATTSSSSNHTIEESIRKTMQMHEDIFQQQVRELHRLYTIQKRMMEEANKQHCRSHSSTSKWPLPPPHVAEEDEIARNMNSRTSIEEDEVELTLSIGRGHDHKKKKKSNRLHNSDPKSLNSSLSIESDTTETSDKDKKRPFWLFQV